MSHNTDGTIKDNIVSESKLSAAVRGKLNSPGSGSGTVSDGSISTAKLADNAVTSPKLAAGSVTDSKVATGISQSKISGLSDALSAKADSSHSHTVSGIAGLQGVLDGKASLDHSHAIAAITGLQAALDAKASSSHMHSLGDLSDVDISDATDGQALVFQAGSWGAATIVSGGGSGVTDHGALTGLSDDDHPQYLNNARGDARYYTKAEVDAAIGGSGSSAVSSVAGKTGEVTLVKADVGLENVDNTADMSKPISTAMQAALGGKADADHTHSIADTAVLQAALDAKAGSSHAHTIAGVTGLQAALDSKADSNHAHTIANVTGLEAALDSKVADDSVVHLTGNETIEGTKTFSSSPVVPTPTSSSQVANKQYVDTAIAGVGGGSGSGGLVSVGTEVLFSSLSGANDDAKLTAFMDANRNQSFKGKTLVLDEVRDYTFSQQQTLYSGFSIRGPFRPQDQARGSLPLGSRIRLRMSGAPKGWFIAPAGVNTFGVSMSNLSIDGDASSRLIEGSSGVIWTSVFRDISVQNALGVFGSPSQKVLFTACSIDGWWNINNVQNRAWYIGGSDCFITPSMMLLDSPTTLLPDDQFLAEFNYMSKTVVEHMYVTAEGHSAFRFTGGAYEQPVTCYGRPGSDWAQRWWCYSCVWRRCLY